MKPSELEFGALDALQVSAVEDQDLPTKGSSVTFRWSASLHAYQLVTTVGLVELQRPPPRVESRLSTLLQRGNYLAWVAECSGREVVIGLRQFAVGFVSDLPLHIVLTEDVLRDVAQRIRLSQADTLKWVHREFLMHSSPGTTVEDAHRVLVSEIPQQRSGGARMFGQTSALDLRIEDGVTKAIRFVRRPGRSDLALTLLEAPVRFVDGSAAATFERTGRNELEAIVREASSYLGLWDRYNEVEAKHVLARLSEIGTARFDKADIRDDGILVQFGKEAAGFLEAITDFDGLVEIAAHPPPVFTADGSEGLLSQFDDVASTSTEIAAVNITRSQLRLRLDDDVDLDALQVPSEGYVFPSVRGDRTRLMRRSEARGRIARGEAAIPQIGLILEGRPAVSASRSRPLKLSAAARACFNGDPTPAQRRALQAAITTPDIALIQGPPGTGKTQVIAALQVMIAEQEGDAAGSNQILLTSYQHDAVENVTARTRVFGLPPVRVGSRKRTGATDPVDLWREQLRASLDRDLATRDGGSIGILREAERWVRAYQVQPMDAKATSHLLTAVREVAAGRLSTLVAERLDAVERRIAEEQARLSMAESHLALRALRGLPTTVAALEDDGAWRIDKALRLADGAQLLLDAEREQLLRLRDEAPSLEVASELEDLKTRLIERATTAPELAAHGQVDDEILDLLVAVANDLERSVRESRDGTALAVEQFIDALEFDPWGVRDALRHYTTVLSSTVQQAVAPRMLFAKGVDSVDALRFETVIVDEAARANPLDLMIPMSLAGRRVILVGDHKQLPQVLEPSIEREMSDLADDARAALSMSLFERLLRMMRADEAHSGIQRVVTLDAQFRMHPVLGEFVSDAFYREDGGVRSPRTADEFVHGIDPYGEAPAVWVDVGAERGREVRRGSGRSRRAEADAVASELDRCLRTGPSSHTFGVIAFYRAQVREIWNALGRLGLAHETEGGDWRMSVGDAEHGVGGTALGDRVRIGTVDSFQGMEFDVVLLSTTRSNDIPEDKPRRKYGFLTLENRLCVAMSRQQRLLIAFGDESMYRSEAATLAVPALVQFLDLCRNHGHFVSA